MTRIAALFFDGRTARAHAATLQFDPDGRVRVIAAGIERSYPIASLEVRDRVGAQAPREVLFPDGASARVPPVPGVDALLDGVGRRPGRGLLRRLEANWRWATLAAMAIVLAAALFVRYGIPALSAVVAARIPPALETRIGAQSLEGLDDSWLRPSRLPDARRAALHRRFTALAASAPLQGAPARLEFRGSPKIGPNAFALPGGVVVLTDEIVAVAASDDELEAVLAHEYGHLVGRHGLRQLVQGALVATAVALLTSDASGVVSMAAAAPAVLLQAGYSRDMERDADEFAWRWLDSRHIGRQTLTMLLTRIEARSGTGEVPTILSTHPSLRQRADSARRR